MMQKSAGTFRWRRGFGRVWLVLGGVWLIFAADQFGAADHINYAVRYYRDPASLRQEQLQWACSQESIQLLEAQRRAEQRSDDFDRIARPDSLQGRTMEALLRQFKAEQNSDAAKAQELAGALQKCRVSFIIQAPEWGWVAWLFLPPTIGVVLVLLIGLAVFQIVRWVLHGFTP
jgi:hypothetical protein